MEVISTKQKPIDTFVKGSRAIWQFFIGNVVFDAAFKVFLTASSAVRASRPLINKALE